ncbi:hypothetical protein [Microbacterium sp.]|uniref:hypothetical protein n=1 Tax=Microbacterium sp. TaxID=51671 RepID=UPI0039E327EF
MMQDPTIAPEGEVPDQRRVLGTAQAGSPLDLRARELLARLSRDPDMDESVRTRAAEALAGRATLRDVAQVPAFAARMEEAGRVLRSALADMDDEQREAVRTAFLRGADGGSETTGRGGTDAP